MCMSVTELCCFKCYLLKWGGKIHVLFGKVRCIVSVCKAVLLVNNVPALPWLTSLSFITFPESFTTCNSTMARYQHLELFLGVIPLLGIISGALKWNSAIVFILNILSLAPLGSWIDLSVNALTVGGGRAVNEILKSTLGNSVELMVMSSYLI
jgi:hypothetical protein